MKEKKIALISVFDKTGLIPFANALVENGYEIYSTGNTARVLSQNRIPAIQVSDLTGFPEILDGRVKTLHPYLHGGILADRSKESHLKTLRKHGIPQIELVVINLYPFAKALKEKKSQSQMIEMIDIGGPTMLRAAAKNFSYVASVCDANDYEEVLDYLTYAKTPKGKRFRMKLAHKVFSHISQYDTLIANYLNPDFEKAIPDNFNPSYQLNKSLRYGENPHQNAGVFIQTNCNELGLCDAKVLHGKELSFNNYLDLEAAWKMVSDFEQAAACVVKHNNPCGFAIHDNVQKAFLKAHEGDPLSAFGGIVGINREVDPKTAQSIFDSGFLECVIAPKFSKKALSILTKKKNLRLVELKNKKKSKSLDFKKISGGLLVQDHNEKKCSARDLKHVTKKKPSKQQVGDMLIAFKLVKHIKSNAIVLVKDNQIVGAGMGLTSRVDAVELALKKAGKKSVGAVMASDGFFPKPDSIQKAAKKGIKSIIQPGGSIQDPVVIQACNKAQISMSFTGQRCFTH